MSAEGQRDAPLVILFVAFFFYLGIQTPFHSPWLASRGIDRAAIATIGTMVLIANTFGQVALPLLTARWGVARVLASASALAAPATLLFLLFRSEAAFAALACLTGFAAGAVIPLADAEVLRRPALPYGRIRLFGSVGFAAAALIGGAFIDLAGPDIVILLEAASLAVVAGASVRILSRSALPSCPPAPRRSFSSILSSISSLRLWLLIIGVALVNASHAYYYLFANIDWAAQGTISNTNLGMLWAIGIASEIAVMAYFGRRESRGRALALMLAGAAGAALRWTINGLHPSFAVLCALQLLHGLSFAATLLGGIQMLRRIVPASAVSPALGLFAAMVHGVVIGIVSASLAQAPDSEAIGYPLMAAVALLGGAVILLLAWRTRRGTPEPEPACSPATSTD